MALIEAMGMASAFGPLLSSCAALRAGIAGASKAPDFECFHPGDEEPQPVMVMALPAATFGFSGAGRLTAIAGEVLRDLGSRADLARLGRDAPFFLALPDPRERGIDDLAADEDPARRVDALGGRVLAQCLRNLDLQWRGPQRFFGGGHAGFTAALGAAMQELARGAARACVVAGIDSLVEDPTLEMLLDQGRLKTGDNPVGFTPGEAGAALVLTSDAAAAPGAEPTPVFLRAVESGHEPNHRGMEALPDGRALGRCGIAALGGRAQGDVPFVIADHNGEAYRAAEWGAAQMHLRAHDEAWKDLIAWFPAAGFGDVGAASGAVAACVAVRSMQHGYAPSRACLILCSADQGERGAILLRALGG